jgi:hypothetical protein
MDTNESIVEPKNDWKIRALVLGGLIGALTGLGAAYLMVQRSEKEGTPPNLTAGEGVKLGLLLLGVLRQVAMLGGGE